MIEVEIPGKGVAEFPDEMSPRDIEHTLFTSFPELADTPIKQKKAELLAARAEAMKGVGMGELQQAVGEGIDEGLNSPFKAIPRPPKLAPMADIPPEVPLPVSRETLKNVAASIDTFFEKAIGVVESVETPLSVGLIATGTVAPKAVGAVVGLMGAGQTIAGAQETAEAIKKGDVPGVVGGVFDTTLGAAMTVGGAKALTLESPLTAKAVEEVVKPKESPEAVPEAATPEAIKPAEVENASERLPKGEVKPADENMKPFEDAIKDAFSEDVPGAKQSGDKSGYYVVTTPDPKIPEDISNAVGPFEDFNAAKDYFLYDIGGEGAKLFEADSQGAILQEVEPYTTGKRVAYSEDPSKSVVTKDIGKEILGTYNMGTGEVALDKEAISKLSPEERASTVRHELAHKVETESELWQDTDSYLWGLWKRNQQHPIFKFMESKTGRWKFGNDLSPEIVANLYAEAYPKNAFSVVDLDTGKSSTHTIPAPLMRILDEIEGVLGIYKKKQARESKAKKTPIEPNSASPEIIGMGGAVPSEFEPVSKTATGIKNATVDQERALRGLSPAMQPARRAFGEVWDSVMAKVDQDPGSIDRLIDELRDRPRSLTDSEDAMLLHRQIDLQNEYGKATRDLAQAFDDGRLDAVEEQKMRVAGLRDQLFDLYEIDKKAGTETGRGLNARKMMANEDFTLANLEAEMRESKGGRPLTEVELADAKKTADAFKARVDELERHEATINQKLADAEAARVIAELKASTVPAYEPRVLKMAEQFASFMDKKAESAMSRLRERLKQTNTLDPTIVADLGIVGAAKITRGVVDFAKWSDAMVRELGDAVKPYLDEAFKAAQSTFQSDLDRYAKPLGKTTGDKIKKAVKDMTSVERQTDLTEKIKKRVSEGKGSTITPLVQKLARSLVEKGVTERDALLNSLHGVLKDFMPDLSRRETMDILSGYGEYKNLRKDEVSIKLRDLKGQYQQLAKLEDMANKKAPLRTGIERRIPTAAERELIKAVNAAKRKGGYVTTDPERQLRTALEETKARMQTQIADYERRLVEQDYTINKPPPVQLDTEALRIKADLERIRRDWRHAREKDRLSHRAWWQKGLEAFVKWERNFKLSSPVVFGKLTGAAITRVVTTATEEVVGGALSKIPGLSQVAKNAPREGGINVKAMAKAVTEAITRGMQDAAQTAKKGMSDLDAVFGEKAGFDTDWANVFGQLHGMLKAPVKRAEFTLSLEKRMQHAIANGVDVTDPLVQTRLSVEALNDGYRAIFMQRGFSADMFNSLVNMMEKSKKYPVTGEVSARVARFLLPVVRVPINIVGETFKGVTGTATGTAKLVNVMRKGIENLKPEEADGIMRDLKKGSIGLALLAIGYFNAENVGGYDWREKRKSGEVKTGGFQIFGVDIPRWMTHAPWFELMQFGATIRRTKDKHVKGQEQGITEGMWAAGLGLIEETPFYGQMLRVARASEGQNQRTAFLGELAKGAVVPQAVSAVAKWTDVEEKRRPRNIVEHIEMGVPGLRQNVPVYHPKR